MRFLPFNRRFNLIYTLYSSLFVFFQDEPRLVLLAATEEEASPRSSLSSLDIDDGTMKVFILTLHGV